MYEDSICSLCIAVNHKNTGTPFLFRSADLIGGRLEPFSINNEKEYEYTNIDLIYNPQVPVEGSVGFWNWYSEEARRQRSFPNNTYHWIEYVVLASLVDVHEAITQLRSGIEGVSNDHDYLFEYEHCDDGTAYCLFIKGEDFQRSINSVTIKKDVVYLNIYKIDKRNVWEMKTSHLPDFKRKFYRYLELGESVRKEYIKSVDSVIKDLIKSRITTFVSSKQKGDKTVVRSFLDLIPDTPLAKMLAASLDCDENYAQGCIDNFLATCETYFSCEDYDAQIMRRLIDYDTEVSAQFKRQVQSEWEQQNEALLNEANTQISNIKKRIASLQAHIIELEQQQSVKERIITDLELHHNELQQTTTDIELKIRQKLNIATQNVAEFFSEYALFMPYQQIETSNLYAQTNLVCHPLSDGPEIIYEIDALWDCLQDNLIVSGVEKTHCKPLAAYLLAAYYTKASLIIAGYGADLILNALSATLTNKKAVQIYDMKSVNAQLLSQLSDGDILAVHDTFDILHINKLLLEHPTLYVAIISSTAEELSIEPRGIYNYVLPLFSEYYVTLNKIEEIEGFISRVDFTPQCTSKKSLIPTHVLPVYAKKQTKRLADVATQIFSNITTYDLFMLQLVPVMILIEGREETADFISNANLSDKEKKQLLQLIGERDG